MKTPSPQEAAKTVRELPILFAPDLAQKVYLGLKTETRRLVKPQPTSLLGPIDSFHLLDDGWHGYSRGFRAAGPFKAYQPGDVLYVRETFGFDNPEALKARGEWEGPPNDSDSGLHFKGFEDEINPTVDIFPRGYWKPSIHMPKWAARTWVEILEVRVERIKEIASNPYALIAEGYTSPHQGHAGHMNRFGQFHASWSARYPGSWDRNDWVFVYKFKKVEAPNGRA